MSYGTNQGPFGCPVLSDPGVMLCAMPVTVRIDGLGELLDQQFSVASRGQLLSLGMKDTAMQWRVRPGGPWQALLPGVYLGLTGAPNLPQKEMAALLYAGPGSLITGPVALMHHGLRSPVVLETVDLLVPAGRQRHSTGFARLHRTHRVPARFAASGPLRFAGAARAVADTARMLSEVSEVRAVVADAVQRGRRKLRNYELPQPRVTEPRAQGARMHGHTGGGHVGGGGHTPPVHHQPHQTHHQVHPADNLTSMDRPHMSAPGHPDPQSENGRRHRHRRRPGPAHPAPDIHLAPLPAP